MHQTIHTPHLVAHYVAGVPELYHDDQDNVDCLWSWCPAVTEGEVYVGIQNARAVQELDEAMAGYRMIKAVQVYDMWWESATKRG